MIAACPNCGASVEFRYDDSFVRVCDHCAHAVLRGDRGIETLGKVADLTPIESPLALFSSGTYGSSTFLLVGVAQIHHDRGGIWQEWYAKLDGRWGWLSEAQGRFYLTFEEPPQELPAITTFVPGGTIDITVDGAPRRFTVGEIGHAHYAAARGELPFRLIRDGAFRFVDLDDGAGTFVTIDYGDGGSPPTLFVGRQITLAELGMTGGEVEPGRAPVQGRALVCPHCNAPIELRVPDRSQRVTCSSCGSLISTDTGDLAAVGKLVGRAQPNILLGSKGTFLDGELIVIGLVKRSAQIDGTWYPFSEYLLFAPAVGFRWLVESDGHWSYVQPIAPGAVKQDVGGPRYDGVSFRPYQNATLRVDEVVGEFYWRVELGEKVTSEDFIRPPAMLSSETGFGEEDWSLSTYMTHAQVRRAFGKTEITLDPAIGKAPNQPNPVEIAALPMALLLAALIGGGIAFASCAPEHHVMNMSTTARVGLSDPWSGAGDASAASADTTPAEPPGHVEFSPAFQLDGQHNVEVSVAAPLTNHWEYTAIDLVNDTTGDVVEIEAGLEYYSGYDDGDFWTEGDYTSSTVLAPPPAGTYLLRTETQTDSQDDVSVSITVRQGVFRARYFWIAFGLFFIPLLALGLEDWSFERARWENSNVGGKRPMSALTMAVLAVGVPLLGIWIVIKALGRSSVRGDSD
jgi:hypothetical protein